MPKSFNAWMQPEIVASTATLKNEDRLLNNDHGFLVLVIVGPVWLPVASGASTNQDRLAVARKPSIAAMIVTIRNKALARNQGSMSATSTFFINNAIKSE